MMERYDNATVFHPTKTYHVIRGVPEHHVAENHPKIIGAQPEVKKKKLNKKALKKCLWVGSAVLVVLCLSTQIAHADDLLKSAFDDANATFVGSGKKFIYLAEIVISIVGFMKTRNVMVLTGCVIIAIFLNLAMKIGGIVIG